MRQTRGWNGATWLAVLLMGLIPLLLPTPYGALAQAGHTHNFTAAPAYPNPNLQVGSNGQPFYTGQAVPINPGYYLMDQDYCTGNIDPMQSISCSFSPGSSGSTPFATNNVFVVDWSDGGVGGKFGHVDGSGVFIEKATGQPWSTVTHYKTPGVAGSVTVTVTVADDPHATDPATLMVIDTAYDGQKSGEKVITVTADPSKPTWEPDAAISGAAMNAPAVGHQAMTGGSVACSAATATDTDKKLPSPMNYYMAQTEFPADTVAYRWTATGGSFAAPNSQSTTWSSNSAGTFTLTLTVDDQNDANKPSGDNGTRDDAAVVLTRTVQVNAPAPIWNAYTPISSGISAPMQDVTIGLGASIALTAAVASDIDERVSEAGASHQADGCTYQWSASGNQGSFTSTSQQSTSWTAPNSPGSYTITLRVDDLNDTNRPAGENGSRDDSLQTYTRTIHVYNASWAVSSAIGGAAISAPSAGVTTTRGGMVACAAASGAADNDTRTPLGGSAETVADTIRYTWSASGGSFQDGVVNQDTATWIAPNQGGTFTLTLRVDDQDNGNKPSDEGGTRDDPFVEKTVMVTVKAPQWSVYTPIDSGGITQPSTSMITVDPNQVVICGTPPATDQDRRTDENNNVVTHGDTCTYLWSATGGNFQSATSRDTTWTAPADAGTYTLNLAVDDVAVKNPEGEGTRDDPTRLFSVTVKVRHFHQWTTPPAITPLSFNVDEPFPLLNEMVALSGIEPGIEQDTCTVPDCSFPSGRANNATRPSQWTAPVGTFGYVAGGSWVTSSDPLLVTHWKAPGFTGAVTLTLKTDDTPSAIDPDTNQAVATADDPEVSYSRSIKIVSHRHAWTVGDSISAAAPTVQQPYPLAGQVVRIYAGAGTDHDTCTESGCSFPDGVAPNSTSTFGWSCSAGEFGSYNPENGTFTHMPPGPASSVWWKAPDYVPNGGLNVTITQLIEDEPTAYDSEREANVTTADDPLGSVVAAIKVVRHRHQWEAVDNLSVGEPQVETDTPTAGQVIQLDGGMGGYPGGSGYPGADSDQCLAASCSFSPPYAWNDTDTVEWEATAGGSSAGAFGWLSGGVFVEKQSADPWSQVTHWRAPASVPAGGLPVTLRKTIDDVPEAWDYELQDVVPTYDDAQASGERLITVTRHQHNWANYYTELGQPSFSVSSYNPPAQGVVQLTSSIPSSDMDQCWDDQFTCPFPNAQAPNQVTVSEWNDGGAGGTFGKLVNNTFTALGTGEPWSAVTHYRCPNVGGMVTLSLTIDDVWQGVPEPPAGEPINTYDDDETEAQQWIQVVGCSHDWLPGSEIGSPTLSVGEAVMSPGSYIPIIVTAPAVEQDTLVGETSQGGGACAHNGLFADNDVLLSFDDGGAGGSFGKVVDGAFQPCTPEEVDHYRAADDAEGPITLRVIADDDPYGIDPASGEEVPTADDAAEMAEAQVTARPIFLAVYGPADFLPIPVTTPDGSWPAGDGAKTAQVHGAFGVHPGDSPITQAEKQQLTDAAKVKVQVKVEASTHQGEDSTGIVYGVNGPDFTLHQSDLNKVDLDLVVREVGNNLVIAEPEDADPNGDGQMGGTGAVLFARDTRALAKVTGKVIGFQAHSRYWHPGVTDPTATLDFTGGADAEGKPNALVIPTPCKGANVTNVNAHEVPRVWWTRERDAAAALGLALPERPTNADTNDLESRGPHATAGDGYSVWQEYGGYPESSTAGGGWKDGLRRLSTMRKELLLYVSIMQSGANVDTPIVTPAQAVAAVDAAKSAFAAADVDVYWAWNCVVVPEHDRAVRNSSPIAPKWATFERPGALLGIRTLLWRYRVPGMRAILFGATGEAAVVGKLLNEFGHAPLEGGAKDGAIIFETLMASQVVPGQLNAMRNFTLVHELGHCMGIEHGLQHALRRNPVWGFLDPQADMHPTLRYSHLLMFNGFWPQTRPVIWPFSPTGAAIRK
ncbi:MAG: hypothetical protein ACO1SX_26055, partial [Actinomycetota bacterium]